MAGFKQLLMNLALYLCAWVLHKTYRYRYFNYGHRLAAQAAHPAGANALALWHGNSFVGTLAHTYQPWAPLCSMSPDGQMVAFLCRRMGLRPVLGSSTKGGKEAREQLQDAVSEGRGPAITVDGPKGPRCQAKNGIVDVARKTGIAILPMTAVADRNWQLRSWDRLKIPKPFARVAICYGEPITVPAEAQGEEFERIRQRLDQSLNSLESVARQKLEHWSAPDENRSFADVISGRC